MLENWKGKPNARCVGYLWDITEVTPGLVSMCVVIVSIRVNVPYFLVNNTQFCALIAHISSVWRWRACCSRRLNNLPIPRHLRRLQEVAYSSCWIGVGEANHAGVFRALLCWD